MLRFFRFNDPYRLLGVLIMMVVLSLPIFINPLAITLQELKDIVLGELLNSGKIMYIHVVDDTPWFASWLAAAADFLFGRSLLARHLIAMFLIFFQASLFAFILVRNKAYNESNYLPAFIFGVLCFYSFDMLSLSRELFAATCLLLALNNIFKEIEFKVQRDDVVLNIGIYLGVASMLVFSYSLFLIGSLVILYVFARLSFRKALLLLFGFGFPHFALICVYYFRGGLPELAHNFYDANFTFHSINLISWHSIFWLGGGVILFFFFSLIMQSREARFTRYQSQLMQVMLIWLLVSCVEIGITRELTPHSFITFAPPLTYFISHYLLLIRRKRIAESMVWIFLLSTIGISTAARLNKIKAVDYAHIFVKNSKYESYFQGKRVVVLGNDWGIYKKNYAASYFLNWDLSKEIFEQPEYYENIIMVQNSFEEDKPEVVIDEQGLLAEFFDRLPSLKEEYEKSGLVYIKKTKRKQ